jgi:hypothetical protein
LPSDFRVTTEDLTAGLPAATRRPLRGMLSLCCAAVLCFASAGAFAQDAPAEAAPVANSSVAPGASKERQV